MERSKKTEKCGQNFSLLLVDCPNNEVLLLFEAVPLVDLLRRVCIERWYRYQLSLQNVFFCVKTLKKRFSGSSVCGTPFTPDQSRSMVVTTVWHVTIELDWGAIDSQELFLEPAGEPVSACSRPKDLCATDWPLCRSMAPLAAVHSTQSTLGRSII